MRIPNNSGNSSSRLVIFNNAAVIFIALCMPCNAPCQGWPATKLAPYVTSPQDVAKRMLELARVRKDDIVYDLGAGDGRIVVLAAQEFGAKAIGVEIDKQLCGKAQSHIDELKLQNRARMVCTNLLDVDLSDATVVTLYLTTMANAKVRPNLEKYLRKGARVVSHSFEIPGWNPVTTDTWKSLNARHPIYLYIR